MKEGNKKWYLESIDSIYSYLATSENGIAGREAYQRLKKYGYNEIEKGKNDTFFSILLRQFKSFTLLILIVAAMISFFIGHIIELAVILIIILFIILISFSMEYKASKDMDALIKLTPRKTIVIRDNEKKEILSKDIAVGDVIVLNRGDIVSADARIIESNNLKADESALTGESVPVDKYDCKLDKTVGLSQQTNMVFAGTSITSGNAFAVVVETGKRAELGKISSMIKNIKEEVTPLQKRLDKLSKQFSIIAIVIAIAVFFIGYSHGSSISTMFIFSMAVIISGIPEALPTVVAVTLASGVKQMARKNAIIKKLPAVETLGTCTVICSDKTGTLTQNKMVVENLFTSNIEINVKGAGYNPKGIFLKEDVKIDPRNHKTLSKLLEIGLMCNNSEIKKEKNSWSIDGEPTEAAFIVLGQKAGMLKSEFHKKMPRKKEHPFDPVRKCMSTVNYYKGNHFVYSKGAPEMLIRKAKYYLHDGQIKKLDKSVTSCFLRKNEEYASKGLRVLGLAFKEHKSSSFELKNVENELVFVGLASIRDPPEPSAKESIRKCHEAGIKVVMITGDNEITAKAIASELGIYKEGNMVLTGEKLSKMKDSELESIVNDVTVYARVTPEHKLKIVRILQNAGHIVAMTGDGVNDAPALKKADIGIAMGRCGTEVAKESSELILKDDNFTTITSAVEQGRTIYENIRKFIYYMLVGNFSEVLIVLIAVIVGANLPLTALMILFINLVTAELPSLGLSFEKPTENIMRRKPRDPKEDILSEYVIFKIGQIVPLVVIGTIVLYVIVMTLGGASIPKAQTIAFATIISFELFHSWNARSWNVSIFTKEIYSNMYLTGGFLIAALMSLLVIYLPVLQAIFGTVSLGLNDWLLILLVSMSVVGYVEIQKTLVDVEFKERKKYEIVQSNETSDKA